MFCDLWSNNGSGRNRGGKMHGPYATPPVDGGAVIPDSNEIAIRNTQQTQLFAASAAAFSRASGAGATLARLPPVRALRGQHLDENSPVRRHGDTCPEPAIAAFAEDGDYKYDEPSGTFSIIARDPKTGELGVAVQSNTIAVGSRVRWGRGGVAAIASQASSNPMMGEMGVLLIERGFTAEEARDMIVGMDDGALNRQFAIIGVEGPGAAWTSPDISDWKGHHCGENYCAQGNTLTGPDVVMDMAMAFETTEGPLADRLLAGLEAAEAAGGDRRGTQSAGLMIFKKQSIAGYGDFALDLRVDESQAPIPELRRLLNADKAQDVLGEVRDLVDAMDYAGALAKIDEGLALDPQRDQAYLQMADVKLKMGDTPGAIEALAKTVELNPKAFFQILRDEDFAPIHADPAFTALGDVSAFGPLPESAPGGL